MLKTILVDDEKHCTDRLCNLLNKYTNQLHIIDCFSTVEDAKKGIELIQPDLVFLDIQLHALTAFDLLRSLQQINFQIIFTTAYDQYAIEAIKFSAFDYLLKPIDPFKLEETLHRLNTIIVDKNLPLKIDTLFYNTQQNTADTKKIVITTEKGTFFLNISDIIHCQADNSYTIFHLKDKKSIIVSKTLKHFEELLKERHFFRTHQSHLINLKLAHKYIKGTNAYVLMDDGSKVSVAKRRKEEFKNRINKL